MAFFDISLRQDDDDNEDLRKAYEDNNFHFRIDENGDLRHDETFHSFINVSLFSDRRADKSEIEQAQKRRGWEGDEFLTLEDYLIGSKLWLLEQARNTIDTKNKAVEIVFNALEHFTKTDFCDRIEVTGERILPSILKITANFFVENNIIHSFTFDVWQKTNAEPARLPAEEAVVTASPFQFIDSSTFEFIDDTNFEFTGVN